MTNVCPLCNTPTGLTPGGRCVCGFSNMDQTHNWYQLATPPNPLNADVGGFNRTLFNYPGDITQFCMVYGSKYKSRTHEFDKYDLMNIGNDFIMTMLELSLTKEECNAIISHMHYMNDSVDRSSPEFHNLYPTRGEQK